MHGRQVLAYAVLRRIVDGLGIPPELAGLSSYGRWEGVSEPARTKAGVVFATIHVQAGEPGGPGLAHDAITRVGKLRSVRARKLLLPLADALEARPGSDCRGLARWRAR